MQARRITKHHGFAAHRGHIPAENRDLNCHCRIPFKVLSDYTPAARKCQAFRGVFWHAAPRGTPGRKAFYSLSNTNSIPFSCLTRNVRTESAACGHSFSGHARAREKRSGAKLSFARWACFAKHRRFSNGPGKWNARRRRFPSGRFV